MRREIAEILGNFFGDSTPVLGTLWKGEILLKTGDEDGLFGAVGVISGATTALICTRHTRQLFVWWNGGAYGRR
jgi:hypothetical protein